MSSPHAFGAAGRDHELPGVGEKETMSEVPWLTEAMLLYCRPSQTEKV